jgi:ABC-type multidrug transport system ATPase subunit
MLQKLKLAQADLINPDLLLFDEPYTGLDDDGVLLVDKLIEKIKKQNKSLIMVLHNKHKAKKYSDSILSLDSGKAIKKNAF